MTLYKRRNPRVSGYEFDNVPIFKSQEFKDNVEKLINNGGNVVTITYTEALSLETSGTIVPGGLYRMTDFQTLHKLQASSERNDTNVVIPVEVFILKGKTTTEFDTSVYSESFPDDIIQYTTDNTAWKDLQITGQKGCITYRLDTKNNIRIGNGDWRNFIIRLWACDMTTFGSSAIEWIAGASWGFYGATATYPALDTNLYNASTNPDGYRDFRIATWTHTGDVYHPVNIEINSREFWQVEFPMPKLVFRDGASECIVRDVFMDHCLGTVTFKNTVDLNIDYADGVACLGAIAYGNLISGAIKQTVLNVNEIGYGFDINNITDSAIFSLSGTATAKPFKVTNIYQSSIEITNINVNPNTTHVTTTIIDIYNSKLKVNRATLNYITGLVSQAAYPSKIDFSAQTDNIKYTSDLSTYTTSVAAATAITLSNTIIDAYAGIVNLTGSGTVNIGTVIRSAQYKTVIILKPASGLTISIAQNNVANGFVNASTITANGTNGEVIILTPVENKWIASN